MFSIDKEVFRKAFITSTGPIRMMPDYMIIGAQKGGTTSLYMYLIDHPYIAPIFDKETHFFDINFHKGLPWYRTRFPTVVEKYYTRHIKKQDLITGEASPYYLFHPQAPSRVAKTLPAVKLIVLLRNPIDRAYSQYQHQTRQKGVEPLTFEEGLDCEEKRLAGETEKLLKDERYISFNHRHYSYMARSRYIEQLPAWMSLFPKEQLLILRSEDLYTNPSQIVRQTLEFLNVPISGMGMNYKPFNDARYTQMAPATRERLVEYFKPYNARLYELLGRDFDWDK